MHVAGGAWRCLLEVNYWDVKNENSPNRTSPGSVGAWGLGLGPWEGWLKLKRE